jgi:hypothetical protein
MGEIELVRKYTVQSVEAISQIVGAHLNVGILKDFGDRKTLMR